MAETHLGATTGSTAGCSRAQRELADLLRLKAQQIQRYEAERYASASYERLCEVAHALGVGGQTGFFSHGEGTGTTRRRDGVGEAGEGFR